MDDARGLHFTLRSDNLHRMFFTAKQKGSFHMPDLMPVLIRNFPFVTVPSAFIESEQLTPTKKVVLIGLVSFCHDKPYCWPSQNALAKKVGIPLLQLTRHLRTLEDQGYIVRGWVGGQRAYLVALLAGGTIPPGFSLKPAKDTSGSDDSPPPSSLSDGSISSESDVSDPSATDGSIEETKEKKKEQTTPEAPAAPAPVSEVVVVRSFLTGGGIDLAPHVPAGIPVGQFDAVCRLASKAKDMACAVLDELGARMRSTVVRSPLGYLAALVRAVEAGSFVPSPSLDPLRPSASASVPVAEQEPAAATIAADTPSEVGIRADGILASLEPTEVESLKQDFIAHLRTAGGIMHDVYKRGKYQSIGFLMDFRNHLVRLADAGTLECAYP